MLRFIGLGCVAVSLAGCTTEPFGCESDDQCQVDAAAGFCETNGYCSFNDPECPSGRRYSKLAGGGLAGLCVVDADETTGVGGSTGSGSTSINPMTGLTTELTSAGSDSSTGTDDTTTEADASSSSDGSSSSGGESGIDDGLVVYLDFDEPVANDGTFPTPPGTLSASCDSANGACPTATDGVVGGAAHFDGMDDGVFVPDDPRLQFDTALTVALWARRTGPFNPYAVLVGKAHGDGSANSYEIYLSDPDDIVLNYVANFSADSPTAFAFAQTEVSDDWSHLCGVWDGSVWRLYLDGAQVSTSVLESVPSYDAHPFSIGADIEADAVVHHFPGDIDEVRLYERALSPDEVMQLATRG